MKYLIAGFGSIGRRHLRNLLALGECDIVLYRTFRSTLPEEELSRFPIETDLRAALDHRPNAVIVANPTAHHLDIAIPAARAGCHLLLEKPISDSLARVDELKGALHNRSQVLVGYQFRFHPGLLCVASWLQSGAIGRPLSVRAIYGEYLPGMHPWEDYRMSYSARRDLGGGVVLTLCHPLDYLRWLLGEVKNVWAFVGKLSDFELTVEDTAEIGLEFESGVIGSVHLNYNQRPSAHNLEIVGTDGTIRWDNAGGQAGVYRASRDYESSWEIEQQPTGFDRNEMFLEEMRHFIQVVGGEAGPACTLEDGRRALEIALAAYESAETGARISMDTRQGSEPGPPVNSS